MEKEAKNNVANETMAKDGVALVRGYDFSFIKKLPVEEVKGDETGFKIPRQSLFEDKRKRDLYGKHYFNNNGTYTAVYGTSPVHYYDEDKKSYEDADWVNAESRVFPVSDESQGERTEDEAVLSFKYYGKNQSDRGASEWAEISGYSSGIDQAHKMELTIDKSKFSGFINNIISVKLHLFSNIDGECLLDDNHYTFSSDADTSINITNKLKADADCVIRFTSDQKEADEVKSGGMRFSPLLEIEYQTEDKNPVEKSLSLAGRVGGKLNVVTGEMVAGFIDVQAGSAAFPFSISHFYKRESALFNCGRNWRLNLDQKIVESSGEYFYIDDSGYNHKLDEIYYYIDNGGRVPVEKASVTVAADGKLVFTDSEERSWLVTMELRTKSGLRFITRFEDLKNVEYYEQRQDEEKQLEEYVESYKSSLEDLVLYNFNNNEKLSCVIDLSEGNDNFDLFINTAGDNITVLTYSEYMNYFGILYGTNNSSPQPGGGGGGGGTNHDEVRGQNDDVPEQSRDGGEAQSNYSAKIIEYLSDTRIKKIEQAKSLYREYLAKKTELKNLRRRLPVWQLTDDDERIFGFNNDGNLCLIYDKHGNYISIDRDDILTNAGKREAITSISDGERLTTLNYNDDGNLASITGASGETIRYIYDGELLKKVIFSNEEIIRFDYVAYDEMCSIYSSDRSAVTIIHNSDFNPGRIFWNSLASSIDNDTKAISEAEMDNYLSTDEIVSTLSIYDDLGVKKLVFDFNKTEFYLYDTDFEVYGTFTELSAEADNLRFNKKVDNAYIFAVEPKKDVDRLTTTTTIDSIIAEKLGSLPDLSTFPTTVQDTYSNFAEADWEFITLDSFNRPTASETNWKYIGQSVYVRKRIDYVYDAFDPSYHCIKKTTIVEQNDTENTSTLYTNVDTYEYNSFGEITRVRSWTEGEEKTKGISVSETEYDEKGFITKRYSYNTLDSSSKFYSETEFAENGKTIAEIDETGENKTVLGYDAADRVRTQILPNGSKFSYGYDESGNVTAVTQSTEEGEANTNDRAYSVGCVTKLASGNNEIYYEYDHKRRPTKITVNGKEENYTYYDDVTIELPNSEIYSGVKGTEVEKNGWIKRVDVAEDGRLLSVKHGENIALYYAYNADKSINKEVDAIAGTEKEYAYNSEKRLSSVTTKINNNTALSESYSYSFLGDITQKTIAFETPGYDYSYSYKGNAARDLEYITLPNGLKSYPQKDFSGRNTGKELIDGNGNKVYGEYLTYRKVGDHSTNMPSSIYYANGTVIKDNLKYKYDSMGNITEIKENGLLAVRYFYDTLSRLIREDNKKLNKTCLISYDNCGNILSKRTCAFTLAATDEISSFTEEKEYAYDGDKLVSFGDQSVSYDQYGQPTVYKGINLAFAKDRLTYFGNTQIFYDGSGRRTNKGGILYRYDNEGNLIRQINGSDVIDFIYDESGVCGITRGSSQYYFRKNVQGDVTHIYSVDGQLCAQYVYDAWGNHKVLNPDGTENTSSTFIGNVNPIRYRGYYFDADFGLYYLQTRYYDSETGRFISQDDSSYLAPETINGLNLFAYCANNPVMYVDPNGTSISVLIGLGIAVLIGALVGATAYTASEVVSYAITGEWSWSWGMFWGSTLGGAIGGAVSMIPGVNVVLAAGFTGFTSTLLGMSFQNSLGEKSYSIGEIISCSIVSGILSAVAAGITKNINIPGLNLGRGSFNQVYKMINTKFIHEQIRRISFKTFGKMLAYQLFNNWIGSIFSGFEDTRGYYKKWRKILPEYEVYFK